MEVSSKFTLKFEDDIMLNVTKTGIAQEKVLS